MTLLLQANGLHVVSGASGSELAAVIAASGTRPSLIVADYRLGMMTAVDEVPAVAAAAGPGAEVVVTTGDTSPETRELIEACGWRLLIKPFRPEQLLSCVRGAATETV
ncbi:hypothetical protein TSO352_13800 [Azospirillum sp. TSO35-2]|nr:hypothetical protein TSO352_13800 [Azospirillum sp. TSO35-2]